MDFDVKFSETDQSFDVGFAEVRDVSDGGYERGYSAGYTQGNANGYSAGYDKGNSDGYDKGHTDGHEAGYTEGEAAGMVEGADAERVRFITAYTNNGERTDFDYAFRGAGWNDDTFYLPFVIKPTRASNMFQNSRIKTSASLKNVDFSGCIGFSQTFGGSTIEELGILDFSSAAVGFNGLNQTFYNATKIRTIEKLIFPKVPMNIEGFQIMSSLSDITFGGTAYRSITLQWSPLSVDSMKSLISCLANYAGTSNEGVYKVTFTSACWEALEASGTAPDGNTWKEYVTTVLGWLT